MEEKKLKLGKMKSQEIAEWFGITYASYRRVSKQKLKQLKLFADFEVIYGGVNITKIKCPYYIKNYKDIELYRQKVLQTENGITTIKDMANEIKYVDKNEDYENIQISGACERLSKAGTIGYGPYDATGGIYGRRKRYWAIKLDGCNNFRPMTADEKQLFIQIMRAFYEDRLNDILWDFFAIETTECMEIMAKEMQYLQEEKYNFIDAVNLFEEKTGYKIIRATLHEDNK